MKIRWLGHAAFLVIADDGTRILMDPYESGAYGGGVGYGPIEESADIVTISHDQHEDHNYTKAARGKPVVIKGPGKDVVKGVTLTRVATFHDKSQGRERGPNCVVCLEKDSLRICHLGDLGHVLDKDQVRDIGQVDVLLVPIGGTFTIDPSEATEVVRLLDPRIVIPMHYKTAKCGFPLEKVESFTKGKQRVRHEKSSEIEVRKETLPKETEIIVLEHAL
jgi:L-ascorbate metabolism protein UlaG (beta-lactamase superfamily)